MSQPLYNLNALVEEVDQLRAALAAAHEREAALRKEIAKATAVLKPNMPESGLVDACKQVKQVAISEADNSETAETALAEAQRENKELKGDLDLRTQERDGAMRAARRQFDALTSERQKVTALAKELHALRFALAPASAGLEPWEGMPKPEFFVRVAQRMHESATKIRALGLTAQPPQDAEPAT